MRTPALLRSMAAALLGSALLAAPAHADDQIFTAATAAPVLVSGPSSPDNDLAPSWSFSADDVVSFECSLAREDTLVGDWAPCTSPTAYDLSAQPDGDYTFGVRAIGVDGTTSEAVTSTYALDTSVPAQPTITALPGPAASDPSPRWTFGGGQGDDFECRLDRGKDPIEGWAPCTSPHEYDLTGEPDGNYLFSVRGVGDNGVRGPVRTDGYALDTQAPAAPVISSPPPPVGSARTVKLAFAAEQAAQVECRVIGAVDDPGWQPCTSPHDFDLAGQPDGDYRLAMRATDAAGNTGQQAVAEHTLDTTAPAAPAVDAPQVTPATKLQPTFNFATTEGDAYECRLDGPGGYATGWQACSSPAPFDLTGQPSGTYTFSVAGTDAAGNTGAPGSVSYELIRNPRAVDLQSGPGRVGNALRPRWTFHVDGATGFTCSLKQGTATLFAPATCGSPRTYNLTGKPDGTYTFTVQPKGGAGVSLDPVSQDYRLDSTPPSQPAVESTPVSPAPDHSPAWRFSGDDGSALDCRVTRDSATVVDWTPVHESEAVRPGRRHRRRLPRHGPRPRRRRQLQRHADQRLRARLDAPGHADRHVCARLRGRRSQPHVELRGREGGGVQLLAHAWLRGRRRRELVRGREDLQPVRRQARHVHLHRRGDRRRGQREPRAHGPLHAGRGAQDEHRNGHRQRVVGQRLGRHHAWRRLRRDGTDTGAGGATDAGSGSTDSPTAAGPGQPTASGGARVPASSPTTRTGTGGTGGGTRAPGTAGPAQAGGRADGTAAGSNSGGTARGAGRDNAAGGNPAPGGADTDRSRRDMAGKVGDAVGRAGRGTARALTGDVGKAVFPMTLLIILGGFLLVQSRIDRDDPKLAMAPIESEPDLEFGPPPTRR